MKASVSPVKNTDLDTYTQQKIQKAQAIVRETQPISGTLAKRYLREHRGILQPLNDQTFRYSALKNWMTGTIHPAVIVLARDEKDEVCGLQAIFLSKKTAKKATNLGHHVKLSRGLIGEGAMIHKGNWGGRVALAEGPETALNITEAHPDWTVYVTFGVSNFAKVRLPETTKSVLICADNDGRDSSTAKSVMKSAEKLSYRGITEGIAQMQSDLAQAKLVEKGIAKEHLHHSVEKNLVSLGKSISPIATTSVTEMISTPHIQKTSLETLLMEYIDMELEQTRLVNAMHSARLEDPHAANIASSETLTLAHAHMLETFAEEALQRSDIQRMPETKQNVKPPRLADCGGFIKLRERLQQGEWAEEDIYLLIKQLQYKAITKSRTHTQKCSRTAKLR